MGLDTTFGSRHSLSEEIRYPSIKQVERLYNKIISVTGGEHGYLSKSNLEYLLDTVKDIGERLDREQAIVKKAAFLLYNSRSTPICQRQQEDRVRARAALPAIERT